MEYMLLFGWQMEGSGEVRVRQLYLGRHQGYRWKGNM